MKRVFSILLCACLLVGALAITAMASQTPPEEQGHTHCTCAYVVSGKDSDKCSGHNDELEWQPLDANATSLPTSGNWYLTGDIVLTSQCKVTGSNVLNLCLNGHSITATHNGSIIRNQGGKMTIMNCQATIDSNGYLTSTAGFKNHSITGAEGAALRVDSNKTMTVIGVEISGNKGAFVRASADGWSSGAVSCDGNAVLNTYYCSFKNNQANGAASNGTGTGTGGAIATAANDATMNLNYTTFYNNTAKATGGAISIAKSRKATVILNNCYFEGNEAKGASDASGGAIYMDGGSLTVKNTEFKNNSATKYGGAVHTLAGGTVTLNVTNSTFTSNDAATSAGAIYIGGGTVSISGSTFSENTAPVNGGAIFVDDGNSKAEVTISGCKFNGNIASDGNGGAICSFKGKKVVITDSSFTSNVAYKRGGAIVMPNGNTAPLTLKNCTFTGNELKAKYTHFNATGGALMIASGKADLTCCTFTGNKCAEFQGSAITIGQTADTGATVTMTDCTVTGNTSTNASGEERGGVVVYNGNNTLIVSGNTVIADNDAGGKATGVVLLEADAKLTVGALGRKANIVITTCKLENVTDPDQFLNSQADTFVGSLKMLTYENRKTAGNEQCNIGFNTSDKFYFAKYEGHKHAVCACALSVDGCPDHTEAGEKVLWKLWESTTSLPTEPGYWYLDEDVKLSKSYAWTDIEGKGIYICLNGCSITASDLNAPMIIVGTSAKPSNLTMINCQATFEEGKMTSNAGVVNGTSNKDQGVAFKVDTSNLTLVGVNVSGNTCSYDNENAAHTGWNSGALFVKGADSKLTVRYGKFENNKATGATVGAGGAITLRDGCTADISNTYFGNNSAVKYGGAINVANANLSLADCVFENNKTTGSGSMGGAVSVEAGTVSLAGQTVMAENYAGTTTSNLALTKPGMKVIANQMSGTACVGIHTPETSDDPNTFITKGISGDWDPSWDAGWITYDNNGKFVDYDKEKGFIFEVLKDHLHCACGDKQGDGCDHEQGDAWQVWSDTTSLPTTSGRYYLTRNVNLTAVQAISGDVHVELCLNGKTITAPAGKSIYTLSGKAVLTISDCKATGTGTGYKAGRFTGAGASAIVMNVGTADAAPTLNVYDGVFSKNAGTNGGAIEMLGGTLKIYNGLFTENSATGMGGAIHTDGVNAENYPKAYIYGGTFYKNTAKQGGGIMIMDYTVLDLLGGLVTENNATDSGGGLFAGNYTTLNIKGGVVSKNSSYQAGGVDTYKSTVNMSDGIVEGNSASFGDTAKTGGGGGIRIRQSSTFNFTGGTVRNNVSKNMGGGIFAQNSATVNMSGGLVTGNEANKGAGIHIQDSCHLEMSGGTVTKNNAEKSDAGGVYVANTCTMNMSGGVISENIALSGGGLATYKGNVTMSGGSIENNYAHMNGGGVKVQGNGAFTMTGGIITGNQAPNSKYGGSEAGNGGGVYVDGRSGACSLILDGGKINGNTSYKGAGIMCINSGSHMDFISGEVAGNVATNNGGGIFIVNSATMKWTGGTSKNNRAVMGGGLALYQATVEMTGGYIESNRVSESAGGVLIQKKSTFNHFGGAIRWNSATNLKNPRGGECGLGGGVWVCGSGKEAEKACYNLRGGSVYGNKANKGGGIMIQNFCIMNYSSGVVSGNIANNNGGGIFAANSGVLNMSGGIVKENQAISGAGLAAWKGTVTISDCKVINNYASQHAAAFLIQKESKIRITGGLFNGNVAEQNAACIHISGNANLNVSNATFSENTANQYGGVLLASGEHTLANLSGCTFANNKAGKSAGVLAAMAHAAINVKDSKFSGNTAGEEGGGLYIRKGYATVDNCVFEGNQAAHGGAMMAYGVDTFTTNINLVVTNSTITGNTATYGGGLLVYVGNAQVENSTFARNTAEYGGGIFTSKAAHGYYTNCVISENTATASGGGLNIERGGIGHLTGLTITGNKAGTQGGGIYVDDDCDLTDVTITGNTAAQQGGGLYLATAGTDGHGYFSSIVKIMGNTVIFDNNGTAKNLYVADGSYANVVSLGDSAKIGVTVNGRPLLKTLVGFYNYEGTDPEYIVTKGDRSASGYKLTGKPENTDTPTTAPTDPSAPVENQNSQPENNNGSIIAIVACGAAAVIAAAGAVVVAAKKKKASK